MGENRVEKLGQKVLDHAFISACPEERDRPSFSGCGSCPGSPAPLHHVDH